MPFRNKRKRSFHAQEQDRWRQKRSRKHHWQQRTKERGPVFVFNNDQAEQHERSLERETVKQVVRVAHVPEPANGRQSEGTGEPAIGAAKCDETDDGESNEKNAGTNREPDGALEWQQRRCESGN